jgi:hypothetical protein
VAKLRLRYKRKVGKNQVPMDILLPWRLPTFPGRPCSDDEVARFLMVLFFIKFDSERGALSTISFFASRIQFRAKIASEIGKL